MKKFFSIFWACSMIFLLSINAFAESINVELNFNSNDNSLIVSGTLDTVKGNVPLNAILKYGDTIVDVKTTRSELKNGESVFSFEPIRFSDNREGGEYTVTVSSDISKVYKTVSYKYASLTEIFGFMTSLKGYIEADDSAQINSLIKNSLEFLYSSEEFSKLSESAKLNCAVLLLNNTYTVPDNCDTPSNKKTLRTEFGKFEEDFLNAIAISAFGSCETSVELKSVINKYSQNIGFNVDNNVTAEKETELYKHVEKAYAYSDFADFVSKKSPYSTKENVLKNVYEQALLTVIKNAHSSQTKIIMTTFPTLFPTDTTKFNQLSSLDKEAIYLAVANKEYADCNALVTVFDNLVLNKLNGMNQGGNTNQNSGNNNVGGGSFTNSKNSTSYSPGPLASSENIVKENIFDDIDDVIWAHEAINYLYEKGIINGKSENNFEPMGNVTRAEFIKMVVVAYFPVLETNENVFFDVGCKDWFRDYVHTAYKNGLVVGSDGMFNPYSNITREDMTVILYRLIGEQEDSINISFSDNGDISAYAMNAVYSLSKKGIINGIGNNMFAPKQNATRAQAAQIIYKLLTKK